MTDNPAGMAWQTYHGQAARFLGAAEDHEPRGAEANAQIGIGWALLSLVEMLKPQDDVLLEVRPPDLARDRERISDLAKMEAEYERLAPYLGRKVLIEEHPAMLSVLHKDPATGVLWCGIESMTVALQPAFQTIASTMVSVSAPKREKTGAAIRDCGDKEVHEPHSHNEEGNGKYDWCPGVLAPAQMVCVYPDCTDERDPRLHRHPARFTERYEET